MQGIVIWFNNQKGFGFIKSDLNESEVFVHISEVEKSGLFTLLKDQKVSFDVQESRGRFSACNIKLIEE